MKHTDTQYGGALSGIVVITLILLAGGIYFWHMARVQIAQNQKARDAIRSQNANVIDSLPQ